MHTHKKLFSRRIARQLGAIALLFGSLAAAQERPNILLIMSEDMSARVGAFGDKQAVTPNLDQLATRGTRYPNTFTTAGVCAPSRAAHILGVHQMSVGAHHMRTNYFKPSAYRTVPPATMKAYPELLRRAGYFTFNNSKLDYQFSTREHSGGGPFTIWDSDKRGASWRDRSDDKPFFGFITLFDTHESKIFPENVKASNADRVKPNIVSPDDVIVPPYFPDSPTVRNDIAQHYANIHYMDKIVGEILLQLEKDGEAENTIVIWTTDHGDGLPRSKREIYDSGIKVPMIVYWPEQYRPKENTAGGENTRLISFVDLGPSVLSLAGIKVPEHMHGAARLGQVNAPDRTYVFAAKDRHDELLSRERAVRSHNFKYIRNHLPGSPGGNHMNYRDRQDIMQDLWQHLEDGKLNATQRLWFEPSPPEKLYDVINDPYEVTNLVSHPDHKKTLATLRSTLHDWQNSVGDMGEIPEIEMARRFWPDGLQPTTQVPLLARNASGLVTVKNQTPHASVGYRFGSGPWLLYTAPVALTKGQTAYFKAVRYGWAESTETSITME